ncbi:MULTISPECIES: excisionase [Pseudomonas]|jgi:predicted site-specific integrase-resolvase|uniref:Excisionase n=1 Tax=Pseudomonas tritici TaxID=2745518 RepID=A0A8H9YP76_9PSED|nr:MULTISPECIES: excisionase [Pseudomonas]MBP2871159.1 excisionase [Pseudomonas sp. SWRI144]QXH83240.1 excisionase [Pseudomonas tritici]
MTKLTLAEWAAENYKTPPSPNTLRKWAREGRITPKPIKHGRNYYVDANSQYLEPEKLARRIPGSTLIERVEAARRVRGL